MATLNLRNLGKSYGDVRVIEDVTLDIEDGQFVVFVGPSGCGKSTLIRMIAGLEEITAGDLLIDGKRMNEAGPADRGLAMVFQSYALYPHMTVRQNMSFALKLANVPREERDRKIAEAARILHLEQYLEHKPGQLSGGQRQRVAIGRAIVRNPKVFLFDEPLSNLDAALRGRMRVELARLHADLGTTMIYVTHDQVEAMTMADRIVVLRAGRIEQVGAPLDIYRRPANLFVAGFIGSPRMNFISGQVTGFRPNGCTISLPNGLRMEAPIGAGHVQQGDSVTLGIRPEGLRVKQDGQLQGRVKLIEQLGAVSLLHVDIDGQDDLIVQVAGTDRFAPGQAISLAFDDEHCHVFDADGTALPRLAGEECHA